VRVWSLRGARRLCAPVHVKPRRRRRTKFQSGIDAVLGIAASEDIPQLTDLTHVTAAETTALRHTFMKVQ